MTIKPLLSHKRQNERSVRLLKEMLQLYGAGGWKDTDDLGVGTRTLEGIRRAIREETNGFIWWGTKPRSTVFLSDAGGSAVVGLFELGEGSRRPVACLFVR
jgi:hypothetical protein